jgi:hypothetical protein
MTLQRSTQSPKHIEVYADGPIAQSQFLGNAFLRRIKLIAADKRIDLSEVIECAKGAIKDFTWLGWLALTHPPK